MMTENIQRAEWIQHSDRECEVRLTLEDGSYFVLNATEAQKRYGISPSETVRSVQWRHPDITRFSPNSVD